MARRRDQLKGIFCLETDQWYGQKNRASVEPTLHLLERYQRTPFQHRDVATAGEFKFFLDKYFQPGYKNYPILYLGFHGWGSEDDNDAYVEIGDGSRVTLEQLEQWINGRCNGRIVHFGSCGVMGSHGNRLNRFVRKTQALAVCGYREEVDWVQSAAFEMLLLGSLQDAAFIKTSIKRFDRELKEVAPGLYGGLGFRLVVKN